MKAIQDFKNVQINQISLKTITGGNNFSKTAKNADGLYTDVWEDSNGDGVYGEDDLICGTEPYR